jgi:hypothetical protein
MKIIFNSIKKLYDSEYKVRQHLMLVWILLYLILPITCMSYLLNDISVTETKIFLTLGGIFTILAIVPFFTYLGATIDYYNGRLNNKTGLFDVSLNSIITGLKVLPLSITWTIYVSILMLLPIIVIAPFFIFNIQFLNSIILIFLLPLILLIYCAYLLSIGLLVLPFCSYIFIEYSKDFKHKKYLYNPLTICKYMKKAFKSTAITSLKLYVANIILNTAYSIISIVAFAIYSVFILFVALIFSPYNDVTETISYLVTIPAFILLTLIMLYLQTILYLAIGDIYVNIYKTKIEAKENIEKTSDIEETQNEK